MTDDASTQLRPGLATEEVAPARAFRVHIVSGPDVGGELVLQPSRPQRALVGQGPACDLRLTDRAASRRHAALTIDGSRLRISDLGSTNGTFVGGVPVVDAFVLPGLEVRLGDTVLRVDAIDPEGDGALSTEMRFGRLLGGSPAMRRLYPRLEALVDGDLPVLVEGEAGTGKELLAESLHEASPRAGGPFVVLDLEAVAARDVQVELDAALAQAAGGTLLVDEVALLDRALVTRLTRAIDARSARLVAATRRDLDAEVQAGRFDDELARRLVERRVELPPLRARRGDVGLLARHFWRALGGDDRPLPDDLLARFQAYDWPGNVRELKAEVARQLELAPSTPAAQGSHTGGASLVDEVLGLDLPLPRARAKIVEEFERLYVERVLARYGGNVARAATASGIARRYFQLLRARQRAK